MARGRTARLREADDRREAASADERAPGALWTCPACGRPRGVVPHPQIGAAGAHRPLEISRAIAAAGACAEAARFPRVHSACSSLTTHTQRPSGDLS